MKDHEIRELVNQLRDVAIKYHGAGQLREQIARTVRAAILQAQSDDDGEPTDDERIMAIEGIHNCERCSDEGWVIGEMGITRCACGQAGNFRENANSSTNNCREIPETSTNSPAIPEGYRLQPISEYEAMCATVNSGEWSQRWIPVSERMPEGSEEVLCAKEFDGPGDWRKKVGYRLAGKWTVYGASWTPTHWMPLPAAPQEEAK